MQKFRKLIAKEQNSTEFFTTLLLSLVITLTAVCIAFESIS